MLERIFAYAKFNLDKLLCLATKLRGRPCTCDASIRPKAGSFNWVIFITFDDDVEWVFRSPRRDSEVTNETACKMLVSEACTLNYLSGLVPVPEVYSFRLVQKLGLVILLGTYTEGSQQAVLTITILVYHTFS